MDDKNDGWNNDRYYEKSFTFVADNDIQLLLKMVLFW